MLQLSARLGATLGSAEPHTDWAAHELALKSESGRFTLGHQCSRDSNPSDLACAAIAAATNVAR